MEDKYRAECPKCKKLEVTYRGMGDWQCVSCLEYFTSEQVGDNNYFVAIRERDEAIRERDQARKDIVTRDKMMDDMTSKIVGLKADLAEAVRAARMARDIYRWMTGSDDFSPGGKAALGWMKLQPGIEKIDYILAKFPEVKP